MSRRYHPVFFILLASILVVFLYHFGWSGTWHFDDKGSLGGLSKVYADGWMDWQAALVFVFDGTAGPLGRSISLASFLVDGSSWPATPYDMLSNNSLLHIVNGLLLFTVIYRLILNHSSNSYTASLIAAISSATWLFMPIHVSASLMAVQRMTLLSSSFMLLGFWVYLLGRSHFEQNGQSIKSLFVMACGVGGGTLLGAFSKEQALLLPTLIWVAEAALLKPVDLTRRKYSWIAFKAVAFYLPTLVILSYLFKYFMLGEGSYASRDFSQAERLWTQPIILWEYLHLAFSPVASKFGPFHDDHLVYNFSFKPLFAVIAWVVLLVFSWKLRKKTSLLLFAVMWFLVAHLIESSVIALELYFEHRNYLAVIGPIIALVYGGYQACVKYNLKKVFYSVSVLYIGILSFSLYQTTSLFGDPELAAEIWYLNHPQSARSAQYLVNTTLEQGDVAGAVHIIEKATENIPSTPLLEMQSLLLSCETGTTSINLNNKAKRVKRAVPQAEKRFNTSAMLITLKHLRDNKHVCENILTPEFLSDVANLSLQNQALSHSRLERTNLHVFLANQAIDERDLSKTMSHFIKALKLTPSISIHTQAVSALISAGLENEALALLDEYPPSYSKNTTLKKQQKSQWQKLYKEVTALVNNEAE